MKQLVETDFNWHVHQPDQPQMSAAQMKAFLDAPIHILLQAINELIGEGDGLSLSELTARMEQLQTEVAPLQHQLEEQGSTMASLRQEHSAQTERLEGLQEAVQSVRQVQEQQNVLDENQSERLDQLQNDVLELMNRSGGGVGVLSGFHDAFEVAEGLYRVEGEATLNYRVDGELDEHRPLILADGDRVWVAPITVAGPDDSFVANQYVILPADHMYSDGYGQYFTRLLLKLVPDHDGYQPIYRLQEVDNTAQVVDSLVYDPDNIHSHQVPNAYAIVQYLQDHSEIWRFQLSSGEMIEKRVVVL